MESPVATLFHGTSGQAARSIEREGLRRFSFVTDDPRAAEHYARRASCLDPRGRCVVGRVCVAAVLTLDVPTHAIEIDPTDNAHEIQQARFPGSGQYVTTDKLPADVVARTWSFEIAVTKEQRQRVCLSIAETRVAMQYLLPRDLLLLPERAPRLLPDSVGSFSTVWISRCSGNVSSAARSSCGTKRGYGAPKRATRSSRRSHRVGSCDACGFIRTCAVAVSSPPPGRCGRSDTATSFGTANTNPTP